MSSNRIKCLLAVLLLGSAFGITSCTSPISRQHVIINRSDPGNFHEPAPIPSNVDPKARASLQLADQGRILLTQGKPDEAISLLERSIGLDPRNGRSYFYLAEAWLMKGNFGQAEEFNRLAGLYLREDLDWAAAVIEQRERIRDDY